MVIKLKFHIFFRKNINRVSCIPGEYWKLDNRHLTNKMDEKKKKYETEKGDASEEITETGWAWMVLIGCFCCRALTDGLISSLGVFIISWQDHFSGSLTKLTWITSLLWGLECMLGKKSLFFDWKSGCLEVTRCLVVPCWGGVWHWHGIHLYAYLLSYFITKFSIGRILIRNWVYFEQIIVKKACSWKLYTDGWMIGWKLVEKVQFSKCSRHIHIRFV